MAVLLFSYGSLQNRKVQIEHFGRELKGRPDALAGYAKRMVPIEDPAAAEWLGETEYANVEASGNPADAVAGVVFEITEEELVKADGYEESARYHRIRVLLESGDAAWVYLRA